MGPVFCTKGSLLTDYVTSQSFRQKTRLLQIMLRVSLWTKDSRITDYVMNPVFCTKDSLLTDYVTSPVFCIKIRFLQIVSPVFCTKYSLLTDYVTSPVFCTRLASYKLCYESIL